MPADVIIEIAETNESPLSSSGDAIIDVLDADLNPLASSLLAILPAEVLREVVYFLDALSLRHLFVSNKQLAERIFAGFRQLDWTLPYSERVSHALISSHYHAFLKYGFDVFEKYLNKPLEKPPLNPFSALSTLMVESLNQRTNDCAMLVLLKGMLLIGLMISIFLLAAGESPNWSLAAILPAVLGLGCYLTHYYQEYADRLILYVDNQAVQAALPNNFALIDRYAPFLAKAAEEDALFKHELANFYQVYREALRLKSNDIHGCLMVGEQVKTAAGIINAKHIVYEEFKIGRLGFFERIKQKTDPFPQRAEPLPHFSRPK